MTYDASAANSGRLNKFAIRPRRSLARIMLLVASLGTAAGAMMLTSNLMQPAEAPVQVQAAPNIETVDVLVVAENIEPGQSLAPEFMRWQKWVKDEVGPNLIVRDKMPDAIAANTNAIARFAMFSGEPVMGNKLVSDARGGFMSILLPSGKRAVSIEISPETGAGGFVLPNDRVDVILTAKTGSATSGNQAFASSTVLTNVKVMAIDQKYEQGEGDKPVAVGKTATLELRPEQAEILAQAQASGTLSLALRSHADIAETEARREIRPNVVVVHKQTKGGISTTRVNVSASQTKTAPRLAQAEEN